MTKFEEVKRPDNGPLTELNNNMQEVFSQYRKMRQYADYLEYELKQKDEHILKLENENSFLRDEHTTFDSNGNSVEPIIPQQTLPVVPECVDKFITKLKKANDNLTFAFNSKFDEYPEDYWNEAIIWRLDHPEEFALAFITGKYTVEKPQLYRVCLLGGRHTLTRRHPRKTLPFNYTFLWSWSDELKEMREINEKVDLFTEQEIKLIDERYWQFAVPVEEEE